MSLSDSLVWFFLATVFIVAYGVGSYFLDVIAVKLAHKALLRRMEEDKKKNHDYWGKFK